SLNGSPPAQSSTIAGVSSFGGSMTSRSPSSPAAKTLPTAVRRNFSIGAGSARSTSSPFSSTSVTSSSRSSTGVTVPLEPGMFDPVANTRSTSSTYRPARPGVARPATPDIAWQPTLLDAADDPSFDVEFATARRIDLDDTAWVEHVPGWVQAPGPL